MRKYVLTNEKKLFKIGRHRESGKTDDTTVAYTAEEESIASYITCLPLRILGLQ